MRVAVAVALLFPIGFLVDMPFPLGMKAASASDEARELTPWLWGIDGAAGVVASVVAIALGAGVSASCWTGFGCYTIAAAGLLTCVRRI